MNDSATQGSIFTLIGSDPDTADANLLGVWLTVPLRSPAGISFAAAPGAAPEPHPVWCANLPVDLASAGRALAEAEERVAASVADLDVASERLLALVRGGGAGTSFGHSREVDGARAGPERELVALLAAVTRMADVEGYGLGDPMLSAWQEVSTWFATVVRTVVAPLDHLTTIQTASGGVLVARSMIGLSGGSTTVWRVGVEPARAVLHGRAVALALSTRAALVRVMALALRGAAVVGVAFGTPGGPLVALPAVWRFITRVQTDLSPMPRLVAEGE